MDCAVPSIHGLSIQKMKAEAEEMKDEQEKRDD